ncbi:MAG: tetratricopeptide repeat protein [Candidatus Eremiobacterota bacterium]
MICPECYKENPANSQFCKNCGCFLKISEKKDEKKVLKGRYKVISLLGEGGMGAISLAYDLSLNKLCAIKGICKKGLSDLAEKERDAILKPFKKEAEMLASLRHPGLPCVTDYFTEKDVCYLVMDYIEGKDLEVILEESEEKVIPEKQVLEWAIQMCRVLEYLHGQEPPIIHGDIKSANIIVRDIDGRIMLVDFGAASFISSGILDEVVITDGYAPPEQYEASPEVRSDIYALGATMYELLTGELPDETFNFEPLGEIIPDISPEMEDIVMKCLEYEVEDRFSDARELKQHLLEGYKKNFEESDEIKYSTTRLIIDDKELSEQNAVLGEKPIKVMLIDDEIDMCNAFNDMVKFFKGIEFIGYARDGKEGVEKVVSLQEKPDVILMDLKMPNMDGIETTKRILSLSPITRIIIVTAYLEEEDFFDCFEAGASGYILKNDTYWGELEKSIKKAFAGGIPISPDASHLLLKAWSSRKKTSVIELPAETETVREEIKDIEEGKTCSKCGNLNNTKANFCEKCGSPLGKLQAEAVIEKQPFIEVLYEDKIEQDVYSTKTFTEFDMFLIQLKSPAQKIRLEALNSVSNSKDTRVLSTLIDMLDDSDPVIRKEAVILLGNHKDYRAFLPLIKRLKDSELSVKLTVLEILARVKYKESLSYLLKMLKDENPQIRKYVIIALGESGNDRAIEYLKDARKKEGTFSISMKMIIDKAIQKIETWNYQKSLYPDKADEVIYVALCYNDAGETYVRQSNYEAAMENFLQALEVEPTCAEAHMNIARLIIHEFDTKKEAKNEYKINEALLHLNECIAFASGAALAEEARKYIGILIEIWNNLNVQDEVSYDYPEREEEKIPEKEQIPVKEETIPAKEHRGVKKETIEAKEEIAVKEEITVKEEKIPEKEKIPVKEETVEEEFAVFSPSEPPEIEPVEQIEKKSFKEKVIYYEELLEHSPDDDVLHNKLGMVYYKEGDLEKAASLYRKALDLNQESSEAHFNLGLIYRDKKYILKALRHFRLCKKVDKESLLIEEAEHYIKELEGYDDDNDSRYKTRIFKESDTMKEEDVSDKKIEDKKIEENRKLIEETRAALEKNPEDTVLLDRLGELYYKSGDLEASLNTYLEILKLNPSDGDTHFLVGLICKEQQKIFKALVHFKKYMKLDRDGKYKEEAEKYIKELE